jgi:hypothetical protein
MTSNIDPTKPTHDNPLTSDVRANFSAAFSEITALQSLSDYLTVSLRELQLFFSTPPGNLSIDGGGASAVFDVDTSFIDGGTSSVVFSLSDQVFDGNSGLNYGLDGGSA